MANITTRHGGHISEWKNPSKGTMAGFLTDMEILLSTYYSKDWEYQFEGEDGWISLRMQIPSDASSGE